MICPQYYPYDKSNDSAVCADTVVTDDFGDLTDYDRSTHEKECMGHNLSMAEWEDRWATGQPPCQEVFFNIINTRTDGTLGYNQAGFTQVVEDFNFMFATYFGTGDSDKNNHVLVNPGNPEYTPFSTTLVNACALNDVYQLGGSCQCVAYYMCTGNCEAPQVSEVDDLDHLCGCAVSSVEPNYDVPSECDPLCVPANVSKKRDYSTGQVEDCEDTVCVITDISIDVAIADQGQVSFTQLCPQCESDGCTCIVDQEIEDEYQLLQNCGDNGRCYLLQSDGSLEQVDCDSNTDEVYYPLPAAFWGLIIVLLVVAVCVILAYRCESQRVYSQYPGLEELDHRAGSVTCCN